MFFITIQKILVWLGKSSGHFIGIQGASNTEEYYWDIEYTSESINGAKFSCKRVVKLPPFSSSWQKRGHSSTPFNCEWTSQKCKCRKRLWFMPLFIHIRLCRFFSSPIGLLHLFIYPWKSRSFAGTFEYDLIIRSFGILLCSQTCPAEFEIEHFHFVQLYVIEHSVEEPKCRYFLLRVDLFVQDETSLPFRVKLWKGIIYSNIRSWTIYHQAQFE